MPPTIASLSKMLVEEVVPTRPIPAEAPRQRYPLMPKKLVFWPTPSGSALECYCRGRNQAKGVPDAMIGRCFAGYCGSWTEALRGETYRKRSLGPIVRSTVGTASGAKKGSGLR
jgi:hypothetical protein